MAEPEDPGRNPVRGGETGDDGGRGVLDHLLEGCQVIGFDWKYLYVNDAAARHGRKSKRDLVGRTMMDAYPGIEKTAMFSMLGECMRDREPRQMENEFAFPDGSKGWFDLRFDPVPEGVFILSLDITARKRTEEALRTVFERAQDGILVADAKTQRFVVANEAICRMLGCSRGEVLALGVKDIHPAEDLARVVEQFGRQLRGEISLATDIPVKRKDGSVFPADVNSTPIELDGRPCMMGAFRDVTERRRAEVRIAHLNAVLKGIRNVNQLITREKDRDRLIRAACDLLVEARGFHSVVIGLTGPDGKVTAYAGAGKKLRALQETMARGGPPPCARQAVAGRGVVVRSNVARSCEGCPGAAEPEGDRDALAIGLSHDDRAYGFMVASLPAGMGADAEEQDLLREVAGDIAFALRAMEVEAERDRANREVESLARFPEEDPSPVMRLTPDGKILYANPVARRLLLQADSGVGRRAPAHFLAAMGGCPGRDASATVDVEWSGRTYSFGVAPIGGAGYVNLYGRDVTDRRHAEARLRENAETLRVVADFAYDWEYWRDEDGSLLYMSPSCERITGYGVEEFRRDPGLTRRILHPDDVPAMEAHVEDVGRTNEPCGVDFRIVTKSGEERWIGHRCVPVFCEGRRRGRRATNRDISELVKTRKKLSEAEGQLLQAQKLEAIGQLAGGVAHDFNNILMAQIGYCELMKGSLKEDDPFARDLAQVKACADRAAALTRQLLAFSRKQALQPEVLDLNAVVTGIEKMLRRLIGEDIDLVTVPTGDLGRVKADPGQIEQVIMNLAVNARDAMPQGGKLTIETANVDLDEDYAGRHASVTAGPHVMLAITDTGCGMDERTKSRLFEPFFTTKAKGRGTGLGLATVYGIVKQSGGNIWVYSEPGQGTTFKIYLPRVDEEPAAGDAREAGTACGRGELILVVEDEPVLRDLFARMIGGLGYRVVTAANGGEALMAVEEEGLRPDLLITDVVMPGMSGKVLAGRLAKTQPGLRVLYTSGYTDNAIVHHGVLDPGTPFIQKPFSVGDLAAKIGAMLRSGGTSEGRSQ